MLLVSVSFEALLNMFTYTICEHTILGKITVHAHSQPR